MRGFDCDKEGRVPVCVAADALVFVACIDQELLVHSLAVGPSLAVHTGKAITHCYLDEAQLCSEMERRVAIICEVRVLQAFGVVLDYSFEERKVFEMDGPADAKGNVNPDARSTELRSWVYN